ncbi:adenylate/guanylate cyclase domain-containing protein [Vibrio sp. 10N.222.49.A3]|uniref:adenylate/guanylate cyclase domain-containing protein n=1 Tax=Vibrio sp. 10N.222.49.A3 TaxID=3229611 RepID=UPI00354F6035
MINQKQLPENLRNIIDKQVKKFSKPVSTSSMSRIPNVDSIPTEQSDKWLKIDNVVCVFVDMKNSTQLSASHYASSTGRVYTLFTGTAVRVFKELGASYVDIKGDGVFALFDYDKVHHAFASAVTFKTFVNDVFTQKVTNKTKVNTGVHIGIDQGTLLVSKIGLRRSASRGDMHNEVWAGKAVNMAAKLSGLSKDDEIHVSDRFYKNLTAIEAKYSCSCSAPQLLWEKIDVSHDKRFSFKSAHVLKSAWCKKHGAEYLQKMLTAD